MFEVYKQPIVFCDVETTGSNAKYSRITEIACIRYEDGKEVDRFVSLVNPETNIPYNIQRITGISDAMVNGAPTFDQIAERVSEIFEGAAICAHNIRFDYSFVREELSRSGYDFESDKICTVQFSRKLYPEFRSHSLSNIILRYDFNCSARHRALGDTEVLVQFINHINKDKSQEEIRLALQKTKGITNIPPNIAKDVVTKLPEVPGVYSFIGKSGEILYIGKSINIKKRVFSHFTNALRDNKSRSLWKEIYDLEYETTASDLGASLLELYKIKEELPIFNRKSRRLKKLWYLKKNINDGGYINITVHSSSQLEPKIFENIYGIFRGRIQAKKFLNEIAKEHGFCPYLLDIENGRGECFSHQLQVCSGACVNEVPTSHYNIKIEQVFAKRKLKLWPYKNEKELTFHNELSGKTERFVVDNWILKSAEIYEYEYPYPLFPNIESVFDYEMYKVISKYL